MSNYTEEELLDMELEAVDEMITQHNSEVSLYGDSWPGARIEIDDAIANLNRRRKALGLDPVAFRVSYPR